MSTKEFLVVYDYGMGGTWAYVTAPSAELIESTFPELKVVSEHPEWLTPELDSKLDHLNLATPEGLLADLLNQRKS